jgi:hypothetical protein
LHSSLSAKSSFYLPAFEILRSCCTASGDMGGGEGAWAWGEGRCKYNDAQLIAALCSELFLYRRMVRNGSPRVCFYFFSTEQKSELFPLPRNGSERNSECLLLYLIYRTKFPVVFFSAEEFGTEFREFLFRGTAGIPSEITICSVSSVFRGIIFLTEIPNPNSKYGHNI